MAAAVKIFPVGAFESNCAVVYSPEGDAWVIDPGDEASAPAAFIKSEGLTLRRILLTHGHIDHISALDDILAEFPGTPVMIHDGDAEWAFTSENIFPPYVDVPARPDTTCPLADGQTVADASLSARILHTPGHSPGSVCIYLPGEKILFSGDTLFAASVGRTDLKGGSSSQLTASLRKIAAEIPDATRIIPGHAFETTLEIEKRRNPFLSFALRERK